MLIDEKYINITMRYDKHSNQYDQIIKENSNYDVNINQ